MIEKFKPIRIQMASCKVIYTMKNHYSSDQDYYAGAGDSPPE
jgi:hypothetical protein